MFKDLAHELIESVPNGREQSLMLTALQEAMMWANAAVAMGDMIDSEHPELPNDPANPDSPNLTSRIDDHFESNNPHSICQHRYEPDRNNGEPVIVCNTERRFHNPPIGVQQFDHEFTEQ